MDAVLFGETTVCLNCRNYDIVLVLGIGLCSVMQYNVAMNICGLYIMSFYDLAAASCSLQTRIWTRAVEFFAAWLKCVGQSEHSDASLSASLNRNGSVVTARPPKKSRMEKQPHRIEPDCFSGVPVQWKKGFCK